MMQLIDALEWRYAVKQFSEYTVPQSQLQALLQATRLSASSYGLQPYKIIVLESRDMRRQLLPYAYGQDKVLASSHLIVFAAETQIGDSTVDRYLDQYHGVTGRPQAELQDYGEHMKSALAAKSAAQKQEWAHQQAYIALGNLLTSAALLQIDTCPMTGVDRAGFDQVLGLAEQGLSTTVICPIGRRHDDDKYAWSPKVRFDFDDIVRVI
jgi:nitroreductase